MNLRARASLRTLPAEDSMARSASERVHGGSSSATRVDVMIEPELTTELIRHPSVQPVAARSDASYAASAAPSISATSAATDTEMVMVDRCTSTICWPGMSGGLIGGGGGGGDGGDGGDAAKPGKRGFVGGMKAALGKVGDAFKGKKAEKTASKAEL